MKECAGKDRIVRATLLTQPAASDAQDITGLAFGGQVPELQLFVETRTQTLAIEVSTTSKVRALTFSHFEHSSNALQSNNAQKL